MNRIEGGRINGWTVSGGIGGGGGGWARRWPRHRPPYLVRTASHGADLMTTTAHFDLRRYYQNADWHNLLVPHKPDGLSAIIMEYIHRLKNMHNV